jgi:hypothetical protein
LLVTLSWYSVRIFLALSASRAFNAYQDVSRRVTSPNGQRTAILVRDLGYPDLNFKLFIGGPGRAAGTYIAAPLLEEDNGTLIWVSRDYEPTTLENWHEDIDWAADSSLIVVSIQGRPVFAYDFATSQEIEDRAQIEHLLSIRGGLQPTRTPSP